jgi:hypothetical protein
LNKIFQRQTPVTEFKNYFPQEIFPGGLTKTTTPEGMDKFMENELDFSNRRKIF